jgi:hypothetical protein
MSCTGTSDCLCGCCSGISVQTPQGENNLPGLPAIAYRTGTWATFKESMLARLSSAEYAALAGLKTRDDDDFSIALLDASSVILDVLTFYQERLANESYLRTAAQLQSLTELARLICYQPAPGVASSVYLSFSLQAAPGSPTDPTTQAITIPKGTQVQSVPAQGQAPQTFETSADILAKADWNALPVQTGVPWTPPGNNGVYLSGTSLQLNLGDSLLILGADRENWIAPDSTSQPPDQWEVVVINKLVVDTARNLTFVGWDQPFSHESGNDASGWSSAKIFAFRQKVGLFGNNAPDPNLFVNQLASWFGTPQPSFPSLIDVSHTPWIWNNFEIQSSSQINLATPCPKIVVGSWFALTSDGTAQLFKVSLARSVSVAEFTLSGKTTQLAGDFADPTIGENFPLQDEPSRHAAEVWGQSDELPIAEQPLSFPLYGALLDLKEIRPDLAGVQAVAIYGKSQKLQVNTGVNSLTFEPDDASGDLPLKPGDSVTILEPTNLPLGSDGVIPDWTTSSDDRSLRVLDPSGRAGTLDLKLSDFTLVLASSKDPVIQEFALVSSISLDTEPYPRTRIHLASELLNCYDRTATTVNANVGLATQGMSVSEILGSGSASTPNQKFSLKQTPLTFVQAPTPTGRLSTLEVTANGVAWTEAPSLYQQSPSAQVFSTLNQPGGSTDVFFGDLVEGSTLPTGQNNVQANYRVGAGLSGNVAAGSITTLMDRPLGVSGVNNPQAATGGQDAQSVDDIRTNAPLSVLTLGRAVSIIDYQNFAQGFAGIAKANAIWIPSGPGRGVFITVAAAGGSALPPGNPTLDNLVTALHSYGNPLIPINAVSFLETLFSFSADIKYDPSYDATAVKQNVLDQLRQSYSFSARTFGQGVSSDEVAAFIQSVPGVIACNVTSLTPGETSKAGDLSSTDWSTYAYQQWLMQSVQLDRPGSSSPTRICAYLPVASPDMLPDPAEILVLDPNPDHVQLGVLP